MALSENVVMGISEIFTMTFSGPGQNANDVIRNDIEAGEYLGIGLDLGRVSQEQMTVLKTKLEATKAKLQAQNFNGLTKDDILGDLLYTTALAYHAELGVMKLVSAKTMGVVAITLPSETIFSSELKVTTFFGSPLRASSGGLAMDADRLMSLVKALDGDKEKPKQFMLSSGINSSTLEHSVPEQMFSTPGNPAQGISALKALQIANEQGIPIYTINQTNIAAILPQLQLDSGTITDIQSAVNSGKEVAVSQTDITFNGWTGCGYIVIDPNTGAGAYMISGGMNGAFIAFITLAAWLLIAAISYGTYNDVQFQIASEQISLAIDFIITVVKFWTQFYNGFNVCIFLAVFCTLLSLAFVAADIGLITIAGFVTQTMKTISWIIAAANLIGLPGFIQDISNPEDWCTILKP